MKTTRRGSGSGRRASRRASSMHHRRPRGVVVGPVVDVARRGTRASPSDMPAAAEVVVVGPHDDRLVGQRPGPFEHADHVPGRDRLAFDLDSGR